MALTNSLVVLFIAVLLQIFCHFLLQCFLFFIVVVILGHNLNNSQVSVNRTIGPTLVTIYGRGGHLGHVTSIMSSDFNFHVPESFHTKFWSDRHSSFCENPV